MWASAGTTGCAVAVARGQVDRVVLGRPAEGRAVALVAPDGCLLVGQRRAVPRLEEHADAPRHQVAAAAHPCRDRRTHRPTRGRPAPRRPRPCTLLVPSLNPWRLRGVVWPCLGGGRAPEAHLAQRSTRRALGLAGEVAQRVVGDLRIVGAHLHAEVTAAEPGLELVAGERRQIDDAAGRRGARGRTGPFRPARTAPDRSRT